MSDNVEHPSHYNAGGVETIEGIRAALGDGFSDYCLGNVLKYVWRCKHKGKLLEDLRKASKYLEWAIEAAESNCPETPYSSSGKAIPIPHGWRELDPDEMPLATDMHEWMGGWFFRKDDATNTYICHSSRHIRKIGTDEPKPLAIPEGWRELEPDEVPKTGDEVDIDGQWIDLLSDCNVESRYYSRRIIRKIETANTSETSNSSLPDPLNCIGNICDLAESTGVTCPVDSCDLDTGCRQAPAYHIPDATKMVYCPETPDSSSGNAIPIPEGWRELEARETPLSSDMYEHEGMWMKRFDDANCEYEWYDVRHIRKIETASTSEFPSSSIPDPGPGYRLLSKEPPERLLDTDEGFFANGRDGGQWLSVNYSGGDQLPLVYYRRKIEPAVWIPKVGDKVRVNCPGRIAHGKIGVIVDGDAGEYEVRIEREKLTTFNLKAEHLELIEAAS